MSIIATHPELIYFSRSEQTAHCISHATGNTITTGRRSRWRWPLLWADQCRLPLPRPTTAIFGPSDRRSITRHMVSSVSQAGTRPHQVISRTTSRKMRNRRGHSGIACNRCGKLERCRHGSRTLRLLRRSGGSGNGERMALRSGRIPLLLASGQGELCG